MAKILLDKNADIKLMYFNYHLSSVVGSPIPKKITAAIAVGVILVIIFTAYGGYKSNKPVTPAIQKTDHIIIAPKYYSGEEWGNVVGLEGNPPQQVSITSSMELNSCQIINSPTFVSVPGIDDTNPITLIRNGDEIAIPFCLKSYDQVPRTWELMPRDTHVEPIYGAPDEGIFKARALSDGVIVSFDKRAISLPAFPLYASNSSRPQISTGNFTLFLSADQNTKLGDKGFYLLAIRQLDDADKTVSNAVQVRDVPLYLRVID